MRISFDLDEVLLVDPRTFETEPPPPFPLNRIYTERLRKGTVRLIHELQAEGFEVWVYTSSFRSEAYIRSLFRPYRIRFDEIVNSPRHLEEVQRKNATPLPSLRLFQSKSTGNMPRLYSILPANGTVIMIAKKTVDR